MNFFLVHLSLADILTAVFTLIPEIAWTITLPAFWGGGGVCKAVKFIQVSTFWNKTAGPNCNFCPQMFGPYLSSFLLCVTSLDRYQAICKPFKACSWEPKTSDVSYFLSLIVAYCVWLVWETWFSTSKRKMTCLIFVSLIWFLLNIFSNKPNSRQVLPEQIPCNQIIFKHLLVYALNHLYPVHGR